MSLSLLLAVLPFIHVVAAGGTTEVICNVTSVETWVTIYIPLPFFPPAHSHFSLTITKNRVLARSLLTSAQFAQALDASILFPSPFPFITDIHLAYDISPLVPAFGSYYEPSNSATPCECSSVVYSLAGKFNDPEFQPGAHPL